MKLIPQMEPWYAEEEGEALIDLVRSGSWLTEYKKSIEFENSLRDYTGANYCVAVNNGTLSLTLSAIVADLQPGDQVIVPNYTMVATPNAVKMLGIEPKLVDVERETLCLDIALVEAAITRNTKAIILVSPNGRYPKAGIEAFVDLAEERDLILIEDAAQALGSFYPNGKHIGTIGHMGSFSFSTPKIISTGQGGAIVTNDDKTDFKLRRAKDFGRRVDNNDIHDSLGFNFKFTDLQAVIGLEQMKKLPWRVQRKKEIFSLYYQFLTDMNGIQIFEHNLQHTTPWFIDVLARKRNELVAYLKKKNIGTRVMHPPIHYQSSYDVAGDFPISSEVGERGLWLPSSSNLSDEDIGYICDCIKDFYT